MPSPPEADRIPVLAVINTSEEITRLLEAVFQAEGFKVVSGYTLEIKEGTLDFAAFVGEHRPDAVLWDIAIPYEANWALFQQIAGSPAGQRCRFVLTTTNRDALQGLVGEVPVLEIVGKPYDLDALVCAVRRAIETGESAAPPEPSSVPGHHQA